MEVIPDTVYRGINTYMKPSQMIVESDGTRQHVVTTHVGRESAPGTPCWTEVGVIKLVGNPDRRFFPYDNDEGGYLYHGTTDEYTYRNYIIYVTDTHEDAGYLYHIWIDGAWKRSGHLAFKENNVDYANEIWSNPEDPWTDDSGIAVFQDGFLYQGTGAVWWNSDVQTTWWHAPSVCPLRETHSIVGNAWRYLTWI